MSHCPSDPAAVLAFLAVPALALRDGLDDGVSFADTTLAGQPFDTYVWTTLARYRAGIRLKTASQEADWSVRKLRNCGIEITRGSFTVRALRSLEAGPPHPGRNVARQQFYSQYVQQVLPYPGDESGAGANLILDWMVGKDREVVLALSKPISVWKYKGQPELEWRRPLVFREDDTPGFVGTDEDDIEIQPRFDEGELDEGDEAG